MSVRRPVEGASSPGTEGTGCWEPRKVGVGNQMAEPSLQSQYPALSSGSRHNLEAEEEGHWAAVSTGRVWDWAAPHVPLRATSSS